MGWQRLTGQGICSPDTVTGLVIRDHTAEGRTDVDGTVATAGPGGNLASTLWSNRAGRRSRSGKKGSSAYNGCKAAKLVPPGCLHCLWPGAGGPGLGARCPLPSQQSPGASDLGRLKVLRVRPLGPGQVPKRGVEWGARGPGEHGRGQCPRAGKGAGMGRDGPVMWPKRWPRCAPWPSCGGPRCSKSCGPAPR